MRAIPNICIVVPADCAEIFKSIEACAKFNGPVYIRLTGGVDNPPVYTDDYNFQIGKSILLKEGTDVLIVANGTMVAKAMEAHSILESKGISADILNMHTIKPMDCESIEKHSIGKELIVTVEEHTKIGGLGSVVSEYFSNKRNVNHLMIGLPDIFGKTASYEFLLNSYGLTGEKISHTIINTLKKNKGYND